MSKLLLRSKTWLRNAKYNLSFVGEDDAALDITCFQTHQALESAIKYLFEDSGVEALHTHSISDLLVDARTKGISIPEIEVFADKAELYTTWETKSRYSESFLANATDVSECISRIEKLHAALSSNVVSSNAIDDSVYRWCYDNASDAVRELPRQEMLDKMLPLYQKFHKI